jgi:hypothetical protein
MRWSGAALGIEADKVGPAERGFRELAGRVGMLKRLWSVLLAIAAAALLPACTLLPGTGPTSDAVNGYAAAGIRSSAPLPYALVDVSRDTIGFLSQPNLVTFTGAFPDKRPKPNQVVGVGDVLNVSIFEAAPGGLFTRGKPPAPGQGTSLICRPRRSTRREASTFPTPARFRRPAAPSRKSSRRWSRDCGTAPSSLRW